jgi:pimeloyl-ACP methyl ester carboxylesterase
VVVRLRQRRRHRRDPSRRRQRLLGQSDQHPRRFVRRALHHVGVGGDRAHRGRTLSPPTSRRIALPTGLAYHLVEWGAPDAPIVILVHGFLDLGWTWSGVASRLASRYRLVAPDLRGHGDTDWIGNGGYYHFMDYVADLDHVITRVAGKQPVAVVGHSMGGGVSAYWAGMRPERCRALVLLEGLGPPEMSGPLPARVGTWVDAWAAARARRPRVMATIDDAAARLRKGDPLLALDSARELAERGTHAVAGGVSWKHDPVHLTVGPYPYRRDAAAEFWRAIACPVLYVEGAKSSFRHPPAEREWRMNCFRDGRYAELADAGHAMQRHQPAALAAMLDEFLSPRR